MSRSSKARSFRSKCKTELYLGMCASDELLGPENFEIHVVSSSQDKLWIAIVMDSHIHHASAHYHSLRFTRTFSTQTPAHLEFTVRVLSTQN